MGYGASASTEQTGNKPAQCFDYSTYQQYLDDQIQTKSVTHVAAGDLIRDEINAGSPKGKEMKDIVEAGQLVPDELVAGMVTDHLEAEGLLDDAPGGPGFILDGFPRTVGQAELLAAATPLDLARRSDAVSVHVASTPETSSEPAHLFEPTPLPAAEVMARPDLGQAMPGRHDLRGVRGVVARNMAQAWSEIPHIHSMDEIDASLLVDFRTRIRSMDRLGADAVTLLAVAAMASVRALIRYPVANAHVEGHPGDAMVVPDGVHLGIATATERGLVVPVVHDAHHLDLFAMAVRIVEATGRARTGEATTADLTGATFTITNYGSLGGRFATPIIPPGQGAILGLGAVAERPVVVDGAVVARPTLPVVLGADHRIIDGDLAEAFRRSVVEDLTEPLNLLVGG